MNKLFFIYILLTLALIGCDKDTLPKYATLDRLRILAIVANTPELQNPSPGSVNVQITPYISDLGGSGDIQLEIQSCLDPGVALGAQPVCSGAPTASTVQTITMTSASTPTEGLFGDPERTGAPQSGAITVPLTIPPGLLTQIDSQLQYNGISYLVVIKAQSSSSTVSSFRRILISNKSPNANPTIADLQVDSTSVTARPSEGTKHLLLTTSDTPESYQFLKGNGEYRSLTEDYETSWFVSEGIIESSRAPLSEATEWSLSATTSSSTKLVIVGVLRDGRGGVAVKVKTLGP